MYIEIDNQLVKRLSHINVNKLIMMASAYISDYTYSLEETLKLEKDLDRVEKDLSALKQLCKEQTR